MVLGGLSVLLGLLWLPLGRLAAFLAWSFTPISFSGDRTFGYPCGAGGMCWYQPNG
jgi:hypothetical protein